MLSSSHYNNIGMGCIILLYGYNYWNPYYDHKCSQNRMYTKKKLKSNLFTFLRDLPDFDFLEPLGHLPDFFYFLNLF